MLKIRDNYIREKYNKKKEWKHINEDQYILQNCDEETLYKKMFPVESELEAFFLYKKKWFEQGAECKHGDKPLSVTCELVSTCNLACTMCYTISTKFQNSVVGAQRIMPWKIVKKIIDEVANEKIPSLLFSWRGESTLYRDHDENGKLITFPDVLKYARDKGVLEITCLTHGQLINAEMAKKIVEAEPTWINFSIDGLEKNYNKIRTPANKLNTNHNAFDVVVEAIKQVDYYKKKLNKTRPVIRTNTIFPAVLHDFDEYSKFFTNLGVDMITVNEIFDYRHTTAPDELIRKNWYCQYPFQRLTVSANGIIVPCTGAVNEEKNLVIGKIKGAKDKVIRDYNGSEIKIPIDSFSIMEAWNSQKLNGIRKLHKSNSRTKIDPGCKNCHYGHVKSGYTKIPETWSSSSMAWKNHHTLSEKRKYKYRKAD